MSTIQWQRRIHPSNQADLLRQMSNAAFELIKVIELEISGIRDGDGYWEGSDAMGGTAEKLVSLIGEYEHRMRAEWDATIAPTPAAGDQTSAS